MEKNILLTIEYDGTAFHGWQRQPDSITVQGTLEKALSFICKDDIKLEGTGRTDAGVHAYGQRASFTADLGIPTENIAFAVNNVLKTENYGKEAAGAIRIIEAAEVPLGFHARFDAKGKKYVYKIINAAEMDVFKRNYYYHVKKPLDLDAMKKSAAHIIGTKDFKCFQAAGGAEKETTVRTVSRLEIKRYGEGEVHIEIDGDGFLYNMVRIITGTLVEVGWGKKSSEETEEIIEGKDRCKAGHTAPPQGLYLAEVYF